MFVARQWCNLVGGTVDSSSTNDHEEKEQCERMHEIIKQYGLDGEFRCACSWHTCMHAIAVQTSANAVNQLGAVVCVK